MKRRYWIALSMGLGALLPAFPIWLVVGHLSGPLLAWIGLSAPIGYLLGYALEGL